MKLSASTFTIIFCILQSVTTAYALEQTAIFNLEEATIPAVTDAIKNKKITCEWLVKAYLERIKKYNLSAVKEAPINAFTEINLAALDDARKLDAAFANTQQLAGPLHCIPVIVKDNIDTYDTTSTSGSLSLLGNHPVKDAFIVERLRKAGAIILGKGGMDEFANGLYGISSRSGRIGNAYNTAQNPGGSSGGTAAAVSANFAMVGIGTDNSGSVRIPAAFNGVIGLRPSTGLISQNGIFPRGNLDATAGPIARTVGDLVLVLDVIAQPDQRDPKTLKATRPAAYTASLNENGLQGRRIGVLRRVGRYSVTKEVSPEIAAKFAQALQKLQQLGAVIVPNIDIIDFDNNRKWNEAGETQDINEYLSSYPATRKNFADICESDRTRILGKNVDSCLDFINALPKRRSPEYRAVLSMFTINRKYLENYMNTNHLDVLLIPISKTGGATYDEKMVNTWQAPVASNAGLPAITLNIGYTSIGHMPIGIELIGKQYAEGSMIEMAYAYEKHSAPRMVPKLPSANLTTASLQNVDFNNLIMVIGYDAYEKVLKTETQKDLTPERFMKIVEEDRSLFNQKKSIG